MTAERKRRIFTARSLIPFGRGKRVKIPRGPRHCHRGRPGRETTGRVRSNSVARPGRSPTANDPEVRKPAGRNAFSDGARRGGALSTSRGAGRPLLAGEIRLVEREVRMTIRFRFPLLLLPLLSGAAPAQVVPPASESVVVTATRSPEEERDLGSATTVITRERIEKSGATTVLEVLRSVPGVDVLRQGGDGSLTSLFLRGTNSTHALVLVDGARVNSPYFPGYDFSALTTENVERIEVVRGPFSALYGSDAIGGVIQIFTRAATARPTGRVTLEAGEAGQRQGSVFLSAGTGPISAAASYRDARIDGDRPNSDWRARNGSLRLEGAFGDSVRVALEGAILDGELGLPGAVGAETPHDRFGFREERLQLPVAFRPAAGHAATFLAAYVASKPTSTSVAFGFD